MTKKTKIQHCRKIRDRYKDGEFIHGDDRKFIESILLMHRWRSQKVGSTPYTIYVDTDPRYKTRGFYIRRGDGSTTDFSYYDCVHPGKGYRADFTVAARATISGDIIEYKNKWFADTNAPKICVNCNQHIGWQCHVDHHPMKFRDILKEFIDHYNIKGDHFQKLTEPESWDNVSGVEITDAYIKNKWIEYHRMNAQYRILCPECNLREG